MAMAAHAAVVHIFVFEFQVPDIRIPCAVEIMNDLANGRFGGRQFVRRSASRWYRNRSLH